MSTPAPSFFSRARFYLAIFGGLYVLSVGLLTIPFFQSKFVGFLHKHQAELDNSCSAIYLNRFRMPWFANFDAPEKYGLARMWLSCRNCH
jgi:abhydrolase domain-containing protein 12